MLTLVNDFNQLKSAFIQQQFNIARYTECIDKLCPPRMILTPIHYTITVPQVFTPLTPYRVNFDNRISDTVPPSVVTGPLWYAQLQEGVYNIEAQVLLSSGSYCEGKSAFMDLHLCGDVVRLDTVTFVSGQQFVLLTGTTQVILTKPCKVFVTVQTDDTTEPVRVLTSGFIRITIGA